MDLQEHLRRNNVEFWEIFHSPVFSAKSFAKVIEAPEQMVVKTVLLVVDDKFILAVVPSSYFIDLEAVRNALMAEEVFVATESECNEVFYDSDRGVIPPFGSKKGFATLCDASLSDQTEIVFRTAVNGEAMVIAFDDYFRIENPMIADICSEARNWAA